MPKLLIGTGNRHKFAEICAVLDLPEVDFVSLTAYPGIDPPVEDGDSFSANALLKAHYFAAQTGLPCLADDSGIVVNALQGAPGIFSARYAGAHASDADNNRKLLTSMRRHKDRSAHYHCSIAFVSTTAEIVFSGQWHGEIAFNQQGGGGFGYDPLVIVRYQNRHCRVAELRPEEKRAISHRSIALSKFRQWFRQAPAREKS
jgi:XTP/dITP diphosphohydrolase